ncbi:hypothetical protein T484DRAFT_2018737 [Baffinella frigidus]|nr:hypothetical protein T484DRAFT_2018737 [Cryptophyta sp. CCMP2293]
MPRRPSSEGAVQTAKHFLQVFIAHSDSDDHILPKNGTYSPFYGFCTMLSHHASVKDGGSGVEGISRGRLNKMAGSIFQEGMRKPSRNGNPGDVQFDKLARHFLKARWRNPDNEEDMAFVEPFLCNLAPQEAATCLAMLRVCAKWRPGPAGRGGDRALKTSTPKRSSPVEAANEEVRSVRRKHLSSCGTDDESEDEDAQSMHDTVVASARRAIVPSFAPPSAPPSATTMLWPGLAAPELRKEFHSAPIPMAATYAHAPAGPDAYQPAHTPLAAAAPALGMQMSASDILALLAQQMSSTNKTGFSAQLWPSPSPQRAVAAPGSTYNAVLPAWNRAAAPGSAQLAQQLQPLVSARVTGHADAEADCPR